MNEGERCEILVTGGAGFIGSHLCDAIVPRGDEIWCVDNLHLGREENIAHLLLPTDSISRSLTSSSARHSTGFRRGAFRGRLSPGRQLRYLAGKRRPFARPATDFPETVEVLEAMAAARRDRLFFASTSAVFGDTRNCCARPARSSQFRSTVRRNLRPRHIFRSSPRASASRQGAAVSQRGRRAVDARGVYDFIARLRQDPSRLQVLGNGTQTKPYLYVTDLVRAILWSAIGPPSRWPSTTLPARESPRSARSPRWWPRKWGFRGTPIEYGRRRQRLAGRRAVLPYDSSKICPWVSATLRFDAAVRLAMQRILGKQ